MAKKTAHAVLQMDTKDGTHHVMRSLNNQVLSFDKMNHTLKPLYMVSSKNLVLFIEHDKKMSYNLSTEDFDVQPATGQKRNDYQFNE